MITQKNSCKRSIIIDDCPVRHLALFLFVMSSVACSAQADKKIRKIDSLMSSYYNNKQLNGATLVAEDGKILYKKSFGQSNFEWSVANTTDTKFVIASLTKQFVANIILQLCQENKLRTDDPLSKHFSDVPADKASITLQQLLIHTSGLPHFHNSSMNFPTDLRKSYTRAELLELAFNQKLMFKPGTNYQYSGYGYYILTALIEKLEKTTLLNVYRKRIFIPAGMTNSTSLEDPAVIPKLASGYVFSDGKYRRADFRDPSNMAGVGDIVTTVEDYFKYDQALRNNKLLNEEYTRRFFARYYESQGYSWEIMRYYSKQKQDTLTMVNYTGNISGFMSIAYHCIEDNKLIVVFFNMNSDRLYEIADNTLYILFGRK